jgi:hypothetical protein
MDELLANFQTQFLNLQPNQFFKFYKDSAYPGPWRCVVKAWEAAPDAPLMPQQQDDNRVMKKVRKTVEWMFGGNVQLFHQADNKSSRKLGDNPQLACAEIGLMHLLANCKCCLGGNNMSNYFDFSPPSLEEYLGMVV